MDIHFQDAQRFVVSDFENDEFNVTGDKQIFELNALATFILSLAAPTLFCEFTVGVLISIQSISK